MQVSDKRMPKQSAASDHFSEWDIIKKLLFNRPIAAEGAGILMRAHAWLRGWNNNPSPDTPDTLLPGLMTSRFDPAQTQSRLIQ